MRKKLLIGLAIIAVCFGIASGYIFDSDGKAEAEEPVVTLTMPQVVANDLVTRYGEIEIVQGPVKAEKMYLSYLKDATHLRAVLWIDGLMVELVSAPLATPTPTGGE